MSNVQLSGLNDLVLNEEIRTSIRSATITAFDLSHKPMRIEEAATLYEAFTTRIALATELIGEAVRTLNTSPAPVDEVSRQYQNGRTARNHSKRHGRD